VSADVGAAARWRRGGGALCVGASAADRAGGRRRSWRRRRGVVRTRVCVRVCVGCVRGRRAARGTTVRGRPLISDGPVGQPSELVEAVGNTSFSCSGCRLYSGYEEASQISRHKSFIIATSLLLRHKYSTQSDKVRKPACPEPLPYGPEAGSIQGHVGSVTLTVG
jgi:hypothetical protein